MNNFKKIVGELIKTAIGAPPNPARKKLSLEEIADEFSTEIDNAIFAQESSGEEFSCGKLRIVALKDFSFLVNYELYFRNSSGNYNMVAKCAEPRNSWLWLTNDAWRDLRAAHEKVFDIEAPAQ